MNATDLEKAIAAFEYRSGRKATPEDIQKIVGGGQHSLLAAEPGGKPEPTGNIFGPSGGPEERGPDDTPPGGAEAAPKGEMGTWETAITSVAKSAPEIIRAMQYRRPYAPAANISGRRAMDIPKTADLFGKQGQGFQSLLAMLLKGR